MSITGVPNGWKLAGFRKPMFGEWIIDTDGSPYQIHHNDVTEVLPVIYEINPLLTCAGRLRAWVRDFGHDKQPEFIADLKAVLDFISNAE